MFDLDQLSVASTTFLDCPAGASSFAAQVRARGGTAVSVDPVYTEAADELRARVAKNLEGARDWLESRADLLNWDHLGSVSAYMRASETTADLFAYDYKNNPQHYVAAALPELPFEDESFDIVLSGNFLFAYDDQIDPAEHKRHLVELCRVARREVRVHPVINRDGDGDAFGPELRDRLMAAGIATELIPAPKSWMLDATHTLVCRPV